jgi:predicted hydrocarbon binding protein
MFNNVLTRYFEQNPELSFEDRVEIAIQHYGAMGLGALEIVYLGEDSADLILRRAHVDKGWVRKWGKSDKPVNFIGAGCIAGLLSAVFCKPLGTYSVRQSKSIAMGDDYSEMKAVRR